MRINQLKKKQRTSTIFFRSFSNKINLEKDNAHLS